MENIGMRKIIWLVLMVFLVCGAGFAAGEGAETPEAPGETSPYCRSLYCTPYWGIDAMDVPVQVVTNDPGWVLPGESELLDGVRYFPYDPSAGLYAVGEGEPAGERAAVVLRSESENVYVVRLSVPGKYAVGDSFFYVLDPGEKGLLALDTELRTAVNASYGETETDTAKKLHHWLCDRVRSVIPADREDLLSACSDPVNALLSGYACREAYAPLYQMLLQRAGVHSLILRGAAGETDGSWNMSFLDGTWLWTDAAMDDPKDQKQSRYLSREAADLAKTHTPGAADRAFVAEMTGGPVIDRLLDGSMPFALKEQNPSSPDAFELFWYDGPACVIGDSVTVTYHRISNYFSLNGFKTPEDYLNANIIYMLWTDEGQFYFDPRWNSPSAYPDVPPVPEKEKMFTVDYAAEDLSTFTVTYRYPAKYTIGGECPFYFVSPSQANLAELVGVNDKAVEKSLSSGSGEKKAAAQLHEWESSRLSYSYGDDSYRSMNSTYEGMGALSFRKCVCSGYAEAWHILMKQSGIFEFIVNGFVKNQVGHSWNINRLDGVWSHTDVTWSDTAGRSYFALAPEKIYRDHEPGQRWFLDSIIFGDPLNLLFQQFESAYLPAAYLPDMLSSLPASADGYGFPGKQPEFILVREFSTDSPDVDIKLSRRAAVSRVALLDGSGAESE